MYENAFHSRATHVSAGRSYSVSRVGATQALGRDGEGKKEWKRKGREGGLCYKPTMLPELAIPNVQDT